MSKKVDIFDIKGKKKGKYDLSDEIFGIEVNEPAIHTAVVWHLANCRQGTQSAKTRAEVSGGGIKPRPQKGSGRSRQGSIRSPQWKGGGVVFAPKPRDYSFKMNKKVKRLAMKSAFTVKANDMQIMVLDNIKFDEIKTKQMAEACNLLKLESALFVLEENDKNVILSARNLPGVKTAQVNTISVYDILNHDMLVMTKAAADMIQEVYI